MNKKHFLVSLLCGLLLFLTFESAHAGFWDFFDEEVEQPYSLQDATLVSKTLVQIDSQYVDKSLIVPPTMFIKALEGIERNIPSILVQINEPQKRALVIIGNKKNEFNYTSVESIFDITPLIKKVFTFVAESLPNLKEKELQEIEFAAINGMLSTLDPHSVFLTPKGYEELNVSTSGSFGGLGIVISIRDRALTVISPISGTPASRAGIKSMDKITRINDESTTNMELEDAVDRMRGEPGTKVKIWVQREGWTEPKLFNITRETIEIKSVQSKLLANDIGYINLKHFQRDTKSSLVSHYYRLVQESENELLKGLILDLRGNPGGLLNQAIEVSDFFLRKGDIVITEGSNEYNNEVNSAYDDDTEPDIPMIVLIDNGSASASEIVAGALKNNNAAVVMGQQSFGKGSVQVINSNFPYGTALKLTIAQYLTPGHISIQNVGVAPHIELNELTVTKDNLRLTPTESIYKEANWQNSLTTTKNTEAKEAKPLYHFSYFEKNVDKPEVIGDDPFIDYPIELAQKLLAGMKTKRANSVAMLNEIPVLLDKFSKEQDLALQQAMNNVLVDWRSCPEAIGNDKNVNVFVKMDVVNENGGHQLKGGDKAKIKVLVTNKGKTPLCQLRAKTIADSGIFNNRELAFGYVEPKSTRAWEVPLDIPSDIYSWNELVDIKFEEQFGRNPETNGVQVRVDSLQTPTFALQYDLQETYGNGDNQLRVGETFALQVKVKNTSNVDAQDVQLNLKNMGSKELLLEEARHNIGVLKAGAEVDATFTFKIKHYSSTGAQLKLFIADVKTAEYLTEEIKLPINRFRKSDIRQNFTLQKPKYKTPVDNPLIIVEDDLPGSYVTDSKIVIKGTVSDKDNLLDTYIYLNSQKVYYKDLSNIKSEHGLFTGRFEAPVTLEEGPNVITIIARESEKIVRRHTFAVYLKRTKPRQKVDSSTFYNLP